MTSSKEHEVSAPTKLDPQQVLPSRWANRHPIRSTPRSSRGSNRTSSWLEATSSRSPYAHSPTNLGDTRSSSGTAGTAPAASSASRSWQRSIPALSQTDLFSAMDRENRRRADLSPFERGRCTAALDESSTRPIVDWPRRWGLPHGWPTSCWWRTSRRRLSSASDHRWTSNTAMPRPPSTALETDRKAVLRRAEAARPERPRAATAVVSALVGGGAETAEPTHQPIEVDGKSVGRWSKDRAGRMNIQIDSAAYR